MALNSRNGAVSSNRGGGPGERAFSTAMFTGGNIVVFLILAASVILAGVLYSQGW